MYEIPSRKDITEVLITREMVEKGARAFEKSTPDMIPARTENPKRESA